MNDTYACERKCSACGELKQFPNSFYKKSGSRSGYSSHCKECHKKASLKNRNDRYENDPFREKHYNLKSSANYQGIPYDLDKYYLESIWTGKCAIFGTDIFIKTDRKKSREHAEVDKINPQLGYVRGNVQWASHRANRLKDNATIEELEMVLNNMKENLK